MFQTLAHGITQGTLGVVQGGDFYQGFASGTLASMASGLWNGGYVNSTDSFWNGLGGSFSQSTVGILTFGTLSGGAGAVLTGGNFWRGAATGLVVSGLNHALHKLQARKTLLSRFKKDSNDKFIIDPYAKPVFNQQGIDDLLDNVEELRDWYVKSGSPKFNYEFKAETGKYDNGVVLINQESNFNNYKLASTLFHEFRHGWQYLSGMYDKWYSKNKHSIFDIMERDAYAFEIYMGNNDGQIKGYYLKYKALTKHIK